MAILAYSGRSATRMGAVTMTDSQESLAAAVERALRLSLVLDEDEYARIVLRVCAEIWRSGDIQTLRAALGECPNRVLRVTELHGAVLARLLRVAQTIVGVPQSACNCYLCIHYGRKEGE